MNKSDIKNVVRLVQMGLDDTQIQDVLGMFNPSTTSTPAPQNTPRKRGRKSRAARAFHMTTPEQDYDKLVSILSQGPQTRTKLARMLRRGVDALSLMIAEAARHGILIRQERMGRREDNKDAIIYTLVE